MLFRIVICNIRHFSEFRWNWCSRVYEAGVDIKLRTFDWAPWNWIFPRGLKADPTRKSLFVNKITVESPCRILKDFFVRLKKKHLEPHPFTVIHLAVQMIFLPSFGMIPHWSSTVRSQIYVVWLSSLIIIIFSLIIHHIFILSNQNNWLSSYFLVRTIYPNLVIPPETVRIDWQLRGAKGRRRDELQQHWHTWRLDLVVEPSENYESQLGSSSHIN